MREIEETWDLAHDLPSRHESQVAEIGDGEVRGLGGDDDLQKLHLLRAHQIRRGQAAPSAARHGVQDLLLLSGRRRRLGRDRFRVVRSREGGEGRRGEEDETGGVLSTMCYYAETWLGGEAQTCRAQVSEETEAACAV